MHIATAFQLLGVAAAVVAGFTVSVTIGLIVLAVGLLAIGIALEPAKPKPPASKQREL